ncbi:hypothetical protein [[Eubacterium] cellulosolvens]
MKTEDKNQKRRKIIQSYLKLKNIPYTEKDQTLHITFPDDQRQIFNQPDLKIYFNKSLIIGDEYELIQPGSSFFEKVYHDCHHHGDVTAYRLKNEHPSSPADIMGGIQFENCKAEYDSTRHHQKYAYLFIFQIAYNDQDMKPRLMSIALDSESFERLQWLTPEQLYDIPLKKSRLKILTQAKAEKAYKKAVAFLQRDLEKEFKEIDKENQDHLNRELNRITRYYRRLREDEKNRISELKRQLTEIEHKLKAHRTIETFIRYQEEKRGLLRKLEEEKRKSTLYFKKLDRFEEKEILREKRKHETACDTTLISIALIQYIAVQHRLLLFNEDTQTTLDVCSIPCLHQIQKPLCPNCREKNDRILLCANSHITCQRCSLTCQKCGKDYCTSCIQKTYKNTKNKILCNTCSPIRKTSAN